MSILKSEDRSKWVNALIALGSAITAYACIRLFIQIGEWFDLEAVIGHFTIVTQALGVVFGIAFFVGVLKNKSAVTYLNEVYGELVKVVWPDKDAVTKATVGIVIGVSIVSGFLVFIDWGFRQILTLVY